MKNLSLMEDEVLVDNIKHNKNLEKCLSILINRHSGLCVEMVNSIMCSGNQLTQRQEMINEKDYHIYQAALKFDPSKLAKFSTYLGNEIKWKCLNIYNKNKKRQTVPIEENLINYNKINEEPNYDSNIFNLIIEKAKKHPDKRVGKIFHLRYVVGKNNSVMPWKNIGKDLGMSIQGCINIHNSIIKNMKQRIKKEIYE